MATCDALNGQKRFRESTFQPTGILFLLGIQKMAYFKLMSHSSINPSTLLQFCNVLNVEPMVIQWSVLYYVVDLSEFLVPDQRVFVLL